MYAQLGDIVFDLLYGPEKYDDAQETTYAEVPLINSKPRLQRTGDKLQEINLGISFKTAFCIPEEENKRMNDKRIAGEILTFIWGSGDVEGDFVIKTIKKTINALAPDGNMRDINLDIGLIEYFNPDKAGSVKKNAVRNAFATTLFVPTTENLEVTEPSAATSAMNTMADSDHKTNHANKKLLLSASKASVYNTIIAQAQAFVTGVKTDLFEVNQLIRETTTLLNLLGVKLSANPPLTTLAPGISTELTNTQSACSALQSLVNTFASLPDPVQTLGQANSVLTVMTNTVAAVKTLDSANKSLKKSAQPIMLAIAARKVIT